MDDLRKSLRAWLAFTGSVLVVAVLYWAKPVLVPVLLALLIAFVLSPLVAILQRAIGLVAAVFLVVLLAFSGIGAVSWVVARQTVSVAQELPAYRDNIRQKIRDVRNAGRGGSVETLTAAVNGIRSEIDRDQPKDTAGRPVVVAPAPTSDLLWSFPTAIAPWLDPFTTMFLTAVLVVFMLLERQQLRDRIIKLFGHGQLAVTTKAFDEAGTRVSRYLLAQSLVNLLFGVGVGIGLTAIGVPNVLLWSTLAATLRFIPYVGSSIAAAGPLLVSLALFAGWTRAIEVAGLFLALELLINLAVEPVFYSGAAGISRLGLLVSLAFWTWLWGPAGLLMATPLTVCAVVMGRYLPHLEWLSTLMSDEPVPETDATYYQRLLAGDQLEAFEIVARQAETDTPESIYDAVMLPALCYAKRDVAEGRLSQADADAVFRATEELCGEVSEIAPAGFPLDGLPLSESDGPAHVLGWAADGAPELLALQMLGRILPRSVALDVLEKPMLISEIAELVRSNGYRTVCIADLPPGAPARSRYLVKRLRGALPGVKLLVGRFGPPLFAEDGGDALLRRAGADHVASTLTEIRDELARLHAASPAGPPEEALEPARLVS